MSGLTSAATIILDGNSQTRFHKRMMTAVVAKTSRAGTLMNLIHTRLLAAALVALLAAGCKHPIVTQSGPEERRIAAACLQVLHSSLTNEADIAPDDPRLPEVIRALHPVDVEVMAGQVVIMIQPRDGLVEYHLSPITTSPGTWQLFGAGPKFNNEHRELLRIHSE
jgi:hypothetical protein